jgi:D-glycero-D-manno-heptose 1,7-bisphosphate phosphatase
VSSAWRGGGSAEPLLLPRDTGPCGRGVRAIFLDRDGTLNELVPDPASGLPEGPLEPGAVRLIPGAAAAAKRLAWAGYTLVCVSNQPAAAKGKASVDELKAVHEKVLALLLAEDVEIALSLLCIHHPEGSIAALSGPCECRKPAPGMLLRAASVLTLDLDASWVIGDTDTDVAAGRRAGCRAVLLEHPPSKHKRTGESDAALRAADLSGASEELLRDGAA